MKKKTRNIILSVTFLAIIFITFIVSIILPDKEYTLSERRKLEQFPTLNAETLSNGEFAHGFEKYTLDQFPLRDKFRKIKQIFIQDIMGEKTCNGFYMKDGYIGKLEYPENHKSVEHMQSIIDNVYNKNLKDTDCNIYLSIIPDKNYFLGKEHGYLSMDYDKLIEDMKTKMPYADYIDIIPTLKLDNFYMTDQHWKQETIQETANILLHGMHNEGISEYKKVKIDKDFYGTYYGQSQLNAKPDTMYYLTNDAIKNCTVTSFDTGKGKKTSVYTMEDINGKDMYDMYLGGPDALLVIDNPNAKTDKELVIFRDSFGSSISPLFIDQYSKITIVDFRYLSSAGIGSFVDFKNQDVLFLYSTLILNNSFGMK